MANKNIQKILEKVTSGEFTPEEEQAVKFWLFQLNQHKDLDLSDEKLETVSNRMWAVISENKQDQPQVFGTRRLWPRIAATAAAVILIFFSIYLFKYRKGTVPKDDDLVANDVAPGKIGATLTLANGKKIKLSDAKNGSLAKEAGVMISKSQNGQITYEVKDGSDEANRINTLSTDNGETYKVNLPDGSFVWLNAASSITYDAKLLKHGKRNVKLQGEAYFEVAKDRAHPFVVQTAHQQVEVLGTHFNINSYADEKSTVTTLLEGVVKVTSGNLKEMLQPGQQALYNGNKIKVAEADVETVMDWKNGDFFLNRVDFREAMHKIARWYDVEIIYDESVPEDIQSSGYLSRSNNLSAVLKSIERAGQVHFRLDGRKVYVSK